MNGFWLQTGMLVLFLALSFAAATLASLATETSVDTWYAELNKPSWTAPGAVIGTVWGILYPLMGIAAWAAWRKWPKCDVFEAVFLWCMQLVFNAAWSICFFGLQNPGLAFVEIVVLWLLIGVTIFSFARISAWPAVLMTPYLLWVTFAAYLNFTLWQMNLAS